MKNLLDMRLREPDIHPRGCHFLVRGNPILVLVPPKPYGYAHARPLKEVPSSAKGPLILGPTIRSDGVPTSVLEAIKLGFWDYDPETSVSRDFDSTQAMPGTQEKISVLAKRLERGLPLWHPSDRRTYKDDDIDR